MNEKIMQVVITDMSAYSWYKIGDIIEVFINPVGSRSHMYRTIAGYKGDRLFIKNCKPINIVEQYPTLVKTYE